MNTTHRLCRELVKQALEMQYSFYNMVPMYESYFNFVHRAELTGFNPVSGANYVYYLGKINQQTHNRKQSADKMPLKERRMKCC